MASVSLSASGTGSYERMSPVSDSGSEKSADSRISTASAKALGVSAEELGKVNLEEKRPTQFRVDEEAPLLSRVTDELDTLEEDTKSEAIFARECQKLSPSLSDLISDRLVSVTRRIEAKGQRFVRDANPYTQLS